MSTATQEIIRLCESLPAEKRAEVADFARFLLSRTEHPDDVEWEKQIADPKPRKNLVEFLRDAAGEGGVELDIRRL
jgi:hypothetical protein